MDRRRHAVSGQAAPRAAKLAPRVAVYVHKDYRQWLPNLAKADIHRADALSLHAFDPQLIRAPVPRLDRRLSLALTVADGELFAAFADGTISGRMTRLEMDVRPGRFAAGATCVVSSSCSSK